MKNIKKQLLSFVLTICMVVGMMPAVGITASGIEDPSEVFVGGTNVVSGSSVTYWVNDESTGGITTGAVDNYNVMFNPRGGTTTHTPTLTLSGASITKSHDINWGNLAGIYAISDIDIVTIGENRITAGAVTIDHRSSYGINVSGGALISGSGVLAVTAGNATGNFGGSFGMVITGNLTVSGIGSVTANGGTSTSYASIGIFAGHMTISNSTVNAIGGDADIDSAGIECNGDLRIDDSIVNATGGKPQTIKSYGINMVGASQHIDIVGSTVTAKTNSASPSSTAIKRTHEHRLGGDSNLSIEASSSADGSNLMTILTSSSISTIGMYKYVQIVCAEERPNAGIDYKNEQLTGLTPGALYIVNSAEKTADNDGKISIENNWFGNTIQLIKKAGMTTGNSTAQSIILTARPVTPTCTAIQPTATSATGTVSAISTLMEYSADGRSSWVGGTGSDISGLTPGEVIIRVKATDSAPASLNQTITITAYSTPSSGSGGSSSTPTLIIKIGTGETVTGTNVDRLVKEGKALTVEGTSGEKLVFDTEALKNIGDQTNDSLKVEIKDVSKDHTSKLIGKLVVSLTVTAGGKKITSFGTGTATISLPYELKEGEKAEEVTVWYLEEDGTMSEVPCSYDPKTKLATFKVHHFSLYVVGTDALANWANPFGDIKESHWFYEAVRFVSANKLMQGTKETAFDPKGKTTRGMIVTTLWRMENQPKAVKEITFTDVKSGQYYHDAVAWAAEKGIASGYSAEQFGPEDSITREQLAVILHNYAKSKGYKISTTADLSTFSDGGMVHQWAKEAMGWANGEGLINGAGNNLLNPVGTAERSQVAAILQRFVENINI